MRFIKIALVLLFLVIGWLVGWANSTSIAFRFLDWNLPVVPVFIIYFAFLALGLLLGLLLGRFAIKR